MFQQYRLNSDLYDDGNFQSVLSYKKVTVEELVAEITPKGRSSVPEDIKADLLQRIRKFLQSTS